MVSPGAIPPGFETPAPTGDLSPLSSYGVSAIAHSSAAAVYVVTTRNVPVLGIKALRRNRSRPGGTATVQTSATQVLPPDPNRTGYIIVNLGNDHIHASIDGSPATETNGIFISGNGGVLIVNGNNIYVAGPASARPDYYDRDPIKRVQSADVTPGATPRALTVDWTYTVPAGGKAWAEHLFAQASNNSTIALATGGATAQIRYTPSGGAARVLLWALLVVGMGSVVESLTSTGTLLMLAGDVLDGRTEMTNDAAGSNISLRTTAILTEFDA